jgi:hypothetical protein
MAKNRSIVTSVKACYDELGQIIDPFFGDQSFFAMVYESAEKAKGKWFGGPNYELFGSVFGIAMDQMVLEGMAPADALNEAYNTFQEERKY